MTINNKFDPIIREINDGIKSFNTFLSENNQLASISTSDPSTYSDSMDKPWGQQNWPSKDSCGVYFLLGTSEDDSVKLGVYIGKASLKFIGHRLWVHLNPYRDSGVYKKSYRNEEFIIEAMCSVPMPSDKMGCLATSLEEFLITRGLSSACLLNSVGRRQ